VEPSGAPWRALESADAEGGSPASTTSPAPGGGLPWTLIAGGLVVVLLVAVGGLLFLARPEAVVEVTGDVDAAAGPAVGATSSARPAGGSGVVVEVGGAVVRPGVYRLPDGSRVADAIAAAGGFGPRVDATLADRQLNLASPLRDGDEVHVPLRGEPGAAAGGGSGGGGDGTAGSATPIDLNAATAEQLDTLPGIGPVTAAKIVAAREEHRFASIDDLGTRKVVGPATLDKIRALVTVGP
jgi:competence protein ComEA